MTDLPKYRSHKIVGAAKIADLDHDKKLIYLDFPDGSQVERAWLDRYSGPYQPSVGKWFVEYDDEAGEVDHTSISPGSAFEDGYSPYDEAAGPEAQLADVKLQLEKFMPAHVIMSEDHQAIAKLVGHVHDGATRLSDTVAAFIDAMRAKVKPSTTKPVEPFKAAT